MKAIFALILTMAAAFPATSSANCWGTAETTADVLKQELRLETNNGPVVSTVVYKVVVTQEVCETGEIRFKDGRVCTSHGRSRKFIRSITLTPRTGNPIVLGQTEKLVEPGTSFSRDGPCTDHSAALTTEGKTMRIGNANTWAKEIADDRKAVADTLSLIGTIIDNKVVFTM